ncbi:hypothetical protein TNCV_1996221 [Trichonephila clavipes]|uniref:Uncharacterized protein n=1 Tax=Trichonephila clavipes TaxID=2585209 RepID=A0A8X6RLU9_TRICX|nr:hypothetical protein TNCV_1996221 [Trichonephila clavipes]
MPSQDNETTQLSCRRKQFNSKPKPLQEKNDSTHQEKNNSTRQEKQLNPAAGMKQLDSAPPATVCSTCNRLHHLQPPLEQNRLFLSTHLGYFGMVDLHNVKFWSKF